MVLTELIESIESDETDIDGTMRLLVQEIIDGAKIFMHRFEGTKFLKLEPIHEFTAIEFRNLETGLLEDSYKCRLVLNGPTSFGIFSTMEVPLDDMYEIRHVIAESGLPEYQ